MFTAIKEFFFPSVQTMGLTLKNPVTNADQRLEVIEKLRQSKDMQRIPALLNRFELTLPSVLQDTKEKELCRSILLDIPLTDLIPCLQQAIREKHNVSLLLEMLYNLQKDTEADLFFTFVQPLLVLPENFLDENTVHKVEQIVSFLDTLPLPDYLASGIEVLLRSPHTQVRYAALECCLSHKSNPVFMDILHTYKEEQHLEQNTDNIDSRVMYMLKEGGIL
jgi:hypothetical protein